MVSGGSGVFRVISKSFRGTEGFLREFHGVSGDLNSIQEHLRGSHGVLGGLRIIS